MSDDDLRECIRTICTRMNELALEADIHNTDLSNFMRGKSFGEKRKNRLEKVVRRRLQEIDSSSFKNVLNNGEASGTETTQ